MHIRITQYQIPTYIMFSMVN